MAQFQQINKWNAQYQDLNRAALNYANAMGNMANAVSGFADNINAGLDKRLEYIQNENLKQRRNNTQEILNRLYQMSPQQLQQSVANGELSTEALRQQFGTNQGFKLGNAGFDESAINSAILQGPTNAYRNAMINDEAKLYSPEGQQAMNMMAEAQAIGDPRLISLAYQQVGHLLPSSMRLDIASKAGQGINDYNIANMTASMSNQASINSRDLKTAESRNNLMVQISKNASAVADRAKKFIESSSFGKIGDKTFSLREAIENAKNNLNSGNTATDKTALDFINGLTNEVINYATAVYGDTNPQIIKELNNAKSLDEVEAIFNNKGIALFDKNGNLTDPRQLYVAINSPDATEEYAREQARGKGNPIYQNNAGYPIDTQQQGINGSIPVFTQDEINANKSPLEARGQIIAKAQQLEAVQDKLDIAHQFFDNNPDLIQKVESGRGTQQEREYYNLLKFEQDAKADIANSIANTNNGTFSGANIVTNKQPSLEERISANQANQQQQVTQSGFEQLRDATRNQYAETNLFRALDIHNFIPVNEKGEKLSSDKFKTLVDTKRTEDVIQSLMSGLDRDSANYAAYDELLHNGTINAIRIGLIQESNNEPLKHIISGGLNVIPGYKTQDLLKDKYFNSSDLKDDLGDTWGHSIIKAPKYDEKRNKHFVENLFKANGIDIGDVYAINGFNEFFTREFKDATFFGNKFVEAVSDTTNISSDGNILNKDKANYAIKVIADIMRTPDSAWTGWGRANNKAQAINQFLQTLSTMDSAKFNEALQEVNQINRMTTIAALDTIPKSVNQNYKETFTGISKYSKEVSDKGFEYFKGDRAYSDKELRNAFIRDGSGELRISDKNISINSLMPKDIDTLRKIYGKSPRNKDEYLIDRFIRLQNK